MKYFIKKVYFVLFLTIILFFATKTFSKDSNDKYSQNNISNYLSGIISSNQDDTDAAFNYLNKVQSLKNSHHNYNIEFIHTLVLLGKFDQALKLSKEVWSEDEFFLEADLLLGLNFFLKKDYINAQKHFQRMNETTSYNLFIEDFLGSILMSWNEASKGNKDISLEYVNSISDRYQNLKIIQEGILQCYFDSSQAENIFTKLVNNEDYNFSRYNFFLTNYLLHKKKHLKAKKLILEARSQNDSNLLLKQTEEFILNKNFKKIKNFFNCKNSKDGIAEIFYILANLYSTQQNYDLSNFYLKISLFLNNKFISNKALLAENFYYQKKYEKAKEIYSSLKLIGPIYSWYAAKNVATILSRTMGSKFSPSILEEEFNLLKDPNFEHYYELANFYKDHQHYEESVTYYSLALKNIEKEHFLVPKILDRRGTSYERLGEWEKAEKDLTKSLSIIPDQPYVLNYLAYSWVEKKINIEKALDMLERANELRDNDGYILDSLGWAHYANNNYTDAKKFLQQAVELLPQDPVINDHFADVLWMTNQNIQARYLWKYVLNLEETETKLKENIKRKLIFGVAKNL